MLRAQYQFLGKSEREADAGNWSASAFSGAGLFLGLGASQASYALLEFGLACGYRPWSSHLFSITPLYRVATLSGIGTGVPGASSASSWGLALGYQTDWGDSKELTGENPPFFYRLELTYLTSALGTGPDSILRGLGAGARLGFRL
jgi:hypothetical protein